MKVCACICELNPFHKGHEYFFRKMREESGADHIVAVMSGDFVQRGLPAICDKYARTAQALMGGADLVIELPVMYATASADYFAQGAVSALTLMGCVDTLCFGSECADMDMLLSLAGLREENDPGLHILSQGGDSSGSKNYRVTKLLKEGMSYARAYAEVYGNTVAPNDMLAVRYIKSLAYLRSDIEKICIKRHGGGYNDTGDDALSAAAVRRKIYGNEPFAHMVPKYVYRNLESISGKCFPVGVGDMSIQLYTILQKIIDAEDDHSDRVLTDYMDVSANIAGRIRSNIGKYRDYESFVDLVHSKEYTKGRIYRALLHIMLDIRKEDYAQDLSDCTVSYIRILGFRRSASALLSRLKENSIVPVISKAGDAASILDDEALYLFGKDIRAANLYDRSCTFRFDKTPAHDYERELVII
ncbi:MAG: nucleotidyltransferase family protein [Lachnospiraceae bacterium]|nr:nucleotidyltransferase family protein [Lachnospiraceae bacterium]